MAISVDPMTHEPTILSAEMIRKAVESLKKSEIKPDHNGDYVWFTEYSDPNIWHQPVILSQPQLAFDPDKALKEEFNRIDQEIKKNWGK